NQSGPARVFRGEASDNFTRACNSTTPEPVFGIYRTRDGRTLLPGTRAIHLLKEDPEDIRNARTFLRDMLGGILPSGSSAGFQSLTSPFKPALRPDAAVAFNPADEAFVCRDRDQLFVLTPTPDSKYSETTRTKLDRDQPALLAAGGSYVIMAEADGRIEVLDQATLQLVASGGIPDHDKPNRVEMSPDGSRGAVLTHAGTLIVYNSADKSFAPLVIRTPRTIASIRFISPDRLAVGAGRTLLEVNPSTGEVLKSFQGQIQWPVHLYDYVVRPLHAILPRPGDLDNTVRYLVTGESSVVVEDEGGPGDSDDLASPRIVFNPWSAFGSNSVFLAVLLLLGCIYISRSDF
ncbi:MAG: hypothetical protein RLZZ458_2913, partial [Planctomycetota bacterium]